MMRSLIRRAEKDDVDAIHALQFRAYPTLANLVPWQRSDLASHQRVFPQGQFVATLEDQIVGYCANLVVACEKALHPHTYDAITGGPSFRNHDPIGDTLYGAEIMVDPAARRRGIGSRFYRRRFELVRELGLHYYVSGGRLPGYAAHKDRLTVQQYVRQVQSGKRKDRTLTMQLRTGLRVAGVLENYLTDPNSGNHASLLMWQNPDWKLRIPPGAGILDRPVPLAAQPSPDPSRSGLSPRGTSPLAPDGPPSAPLDAQG